MPTRFPYTIEALQSGLYRIELINQATSQPVVPAVGITLSLSSGDSFDGALIAGLPRGTYAPRATRLGGLPTTGAGQYSGCSDCTPLWAPPTGQALRCGGSVVPGSNSPCATSWVISRPEMYCVEGTPAAGCTGTLAFDKGVSNTDPAVTAISTTGLTFLIKGSGYGLVGWNVSRTGDGILSQGTVDPAVVGVSIPITFSQEILPSDCTLNIWDLNCPTTILTEAFTVPVCAGVWVSTSADILCEGSVAVGSTAPCGTQWSSNEMIRCQEIV